MTQLVPAALVAPTRPGLTDVGYLVRSASSYSTILANWTAVAEAGSSTGYYPVLSTISVPDAGCIIEWRRASNSGTFLSAVTVEPVPTNFTDLAITAGGAVTAGTISDKTGYSLSGTQSFNLTGNITGNLSGSVGSVTGAVGSVTSPVTAGTVSDKTGYSLSSTQSFNLTGNVTGNLSGSVGSVTGNVSGSVGSVTGAVGSVTNPVTVGTNNDKTGYSLTQAFPTNFASLAITASTGQVTVGTLANNSITAAAIAADAVTEIQAGLATQASVNSIPTTTAPTAAQVATAVEAALLLDSDGQALLTAIREAVATLFDSGADVSVTTLVDAIAAKITADHGAGSYLTPNLSALALEATAQAIKAKTDTISGQGLTQAEKDKLNELWQRAGLDLINPVTRVQTGAVVTETFGAVEIEISNTTPNTVTSTRQPNA